MNDINTKLVEAFQQYMELFTISTTTVEKIEALRHAFKMGFMVGRKSIRDNN